MILYPKAKKHFGQNFFQDAELLSDALAPMNLTAGDAVLEIGPGRGILTELLLKAGCDVLALEIDPELYALLKTQFQNETRLDLRQLDFMHYDLKDFWPDKPLQQRKLIANIPYHLTSPILLKVLNEAAFRQGIDDQTPYFSDICLMVQAEVADKLMAEPGTKAYNALTLTINYAAEIEYLAYLPRELFDPAPKVDSALIRLKPRTSPGVELTEPSKFWQLLERSYQMRRKTLRNVCKALGQSSEQSDQLQAQTGIDLSRRGETLTLEEFAMLANGLAANN